MKLIPLTQGQFAKVDDADFDLISKHKWCASKVGGSFYAVRNAPRNANGSRPPKIYLHRSLMGNPRELVDHENHDTLDCRKSNLRVCNRIQNGQNRLGPMRNSKSGVRGVSWCKQMRKWTAEIAVDKKRHRLGYFSSIASAAEAYAAANHQHFGSFGGGL